MAKLTKQQAKLHAEACELLQQDVLSYDDKLFVLEHWHEGANHINSVAGAFFTPQGLARGVAMECSGGWLDRPNKVIDLCAGIGSLAFAFLIYNNPFRSRSFDLTCVECNPDYIAVGKKIVPEARWIQGDVLNLPGDIGHFDIAIGNPPFGNIQTGNPSPRLKRGAFEYRVMDVASDIADYGVFIVPQSSAPFRFSGVRCYEESESEACRRFREASSIELEANCGIDTTVHRNEWHGVSITTEIVLADFTEARKRRNMMRFDEEVNQVQGSLFPMAA